jgi:hypothetical protein
MLPERTALSCTLDAARRTARVELGGKGGPLRDARGTLLLDAGGKIVGVDVEPDSAARAVVMIGKHEAVARTRDAKLSVSRDDHGDVVSVVVHDV